MRRKSLELKCFAATCGRWYRSGYSLIAGTAISLPFAIDLSANELGGTSANNPVGIRFREAAPSLPKIGTEPAMVPTLMTPQGSSTTNIALPAIVKPDVTLPPMVAGPSRGQISSLGADANSVRIELLPPSPNLPPAKMTIQSTQGSATQIASKSANGGTVQMQGASAAVSVPGSQALPSTTSPATSMSMTIGQATASKAVTSTSTIALPTAAAISELPRLAAPTPLAAKSPTTSSQTPSLSTPSLATPPTSVAPTAPSLTIAPAKESTPEVANKSREPEIVRIPSITVAATSSQPQASIKTSPTIANTIAPTTSPAVASTMSAKSVSETPAPKIVRPESESATALLAPPKLVAPHSTPNASMASVAAQESKRSVTEENKMASAVPSVRTPSGANSTLSTAPISTSTPTLSLPSLAPSTAAIDLPDSKPQTALASPVAAPKNAAIGKDSISTTSNGDASSMKSTGLPPSSNSVKALDVPSATPLVATPSLVPDSVVHVNTSSLPPVALPSEDANPSASRTAIPVSNGRVAVIREAVTTSVGGSTQAVPRLPVQLPSQSSVADRPRSLSIVLKTVESIDVEGIVERVEVDDESVCKALTTESNSIIVMALSQGTATVSVWLRSLPNETSRLQTYEISVCEAWSSQTEEGRNFEKIEEAQRSINAMFPSAQVNLKSNSNGTLTILGQASSNNEAKQIAQLVRKMFLVPVQDRIAVSSR